MKIIRVIALVAICCVFGFNMGNSSCSGQITENDALTEAVDSTQIVMSMPLVTTVNGLAAGEDPMLGDPCLMNYVPAEINFIGYINLEHAMDTLTRFGYDKFGGEAKQHIDDLVTNVEEGVIYADDEGQWGLLIRPKGDMSDFVNDYLTPTLETMNDPGNEDTFVASVVDESAVILSFSPERNAALVDSVARSGVEQECAFVRFSRYDTSPLSNKPMINLVAKAKTSLLDEPLAQALPDMQEEIQKSMAVLNVDKQDGVFRFAFGVVDNTDVDIAGVITYFSFYLDTDSFILGTIIDKFMDELAAGNIGGGGGGDDAPENCHSGVDEACHASLFDGDCFDLDNEDECIASYAMYNERPYNCAWNACEEDGEVVGCYVQGNNNEPDEACILD